MTSFVTGATGFVGAQVTRALIGSGRRVRCLVRATSANRRYVALYHLESPEVQATPAWKSAAGTPWTEKLRPHFRDHLRIVCKSYVRGG